MRDPERLDLSSASSFGMDALCAGRQQMLARLPDDYAEPEDEVATRGTRLHKAWELDSAADLDEEDVEIFNTGKKHGLQLLEQWKSDKQLKVYQEGPREERYFLNDPATLRPIASARLDIHWFGETAEGQKHVLIDERKSLYCSNLPPSEQAWQGRLQVVLMSIEYECEHVRFAFNKPMLRQTDVCDYGPDDITHALAAIYHHIWMSKQPDAQRQSGIHCRYCAAKSFCPEAAAFAMLPTSTAFLGGHSAVPAKAEIIAAVNSLSHHDLVRVWTASTVVDKIQEAVKTRLKSFTDEELAALGLEKGKAQVMRNISNVEAAFKYLRDHTNIPESALFTAMKFSNTDLDMVLKREVGMSTEGAAEYRKTQLSAWTDEVPKDRPLKRIKE